ncbi:putative quinol monooxygenase [uncultured Propionibacterium sp.]|uniref:putative quinol monooxygenase n=1 Tax=uncultured Propionibacterium sp. TaxID=218066 RepID=UPI00292EFEF3|nr:putative quinol monooxygenase [uncultured Propionibacterium sp.]
MIAITVKWDVRPEHADDFIDLTGEFTRACRAEPGCLWFEWSRSVETPGQYILIEAYRDAAAGREHVESGHFRKAMATLGRYVARRPQVVSVSTEQQGWAPLGELTMPDE